MRFIAHFNVCYWRHTAAAMKRRQRWIQGAIAGIGFATSVFYLILTQEWVKALIGAVSSLFASFLGLIPFKSELAEARFAVERWSQLATDTDTLWNYANAKVRGWEETAVAESLESLRERERQFQAREDHVPDDGRRRRCARITCRELLPVEDGYV